MAASRGEQARAPRGRSARLVDRDRLAGYGLITFAWRSFLQWGRTGDAGFRLSRELPPQARASCVLMVAGCLSGPVAAVRSARRRAPTKGEVASLRPIGLGLILLATVITYRSQLDLGRSWRIGVDQHERTELSGGMFGLVRNPIFSGMAATAVGTALAAPSLMAYLGAAALVVGWRSRFAPLRSRISCAPTDRPAVGMRRAPGALSRESVVFERFREDNTPTFRGEVSGASTCLERRGDLLAIDAPVVLRCGQGSIASSSGPRRAPAT